MRHGSAAMESRWPRATGCDLVNGFFEFAAHPTTRLVQREHGRDSPALIGKWISVRSRRGATFASGIARGEFRRGPAAHGLTSSHDRSSILRAPVRPARRCNPLALRVWRRRRRSGFWSMDCSPAARAR